MKNISLFFGLILISMTIQAQEGVTKQGTKALANNDTTGNYNSAFGYYALNANTTGTNNTAVGANALLANNGVDNTGVGYASLYSNTSGYENTALGAYALNTNTTGKYNTAIGSKTLKANTTGQSNTGIGYASLYLNTSGYNNTALGSFAMQTNTTGRDNVALGFESLFFNVNGRENTAVGSNAMHANTTGNYNVALGIQSLSANTGGLYNTALGGYAMQSNTTGLNNTAVGYGALFSNTDQGSNTAIGTTALYNNTAGYNNTAIGSSALFKNTTGAVNTGIGNAALYSNTTGKYNTTTGYWSMLSNTSGYNNTAIGYWSMLTNTTGYQNTAIGYLADVANKSLHNATAIGYDATVNSSNAVRVGNTAVTSIGGQVGWTTFSDGRYKTDIKENIPGLAFINNLRPVSYTLNINKLDEYYNQRKSKIPDSLEAFAANNREIKNEEGEAVKIIHTGFIAQEVEQAAGKLHYEFSGVDKPKTNDDLYGLRYAEFVVPLVKAVQELSKMNDDKDAAIDSLRYELQDLKSEINNLKEIAFNSAQSSTHAQAEIVSNVPLNTFLDQNKPNPFNQQTVINYHLPSNAGNAFIRITDMNGRIIKTVITSADKGQIVLQANTLMPGTYQYALIVNGRLIDAKKMVVIK